MSVCVCLSAWLCAKRCLFLDFLYAISSFLYFDAWYKNCARFLIAILPCVFRKTDSSVCRLYVKRGSMYLLLRCVKVWKSLEREREREREREKERERERKKERC